MIPHKNWPVLQIILFFTSFIFFSNLSKDLEIYFFQKVFLVTHSSVLCINQFVAVWERQRQTLLLLKRKTFYALFSQSSLSTKILSGHKLWNVLDFWKSTATFRLSLLRILCTREAKIEMLKRSMHNCIIGNLYYVFIFRFIHSAGKDSKKLSRYNTSVMVHLNM